MRDSLGMHQLRCYQINGKIKEDYETRKAKWKANKAKRDLLAWAKEDRHYEQEDEIDEIYGDQIGHACIICHK